MSATPPSTPSEGAAAAVASDPLGVVSREIAAVVRRTWGRGPVGVRAHWAGPDLVVVMMRNGPTPQERTLRAAGHDEQILRGREALQEVVAGEIALAVEEALGRRVVTTLSATRLDPDLSAEIFVLEPRRGGDERRALAAERNQIRRMSAQRREQRDT